MLLKILEIIDASHIVVGHTSNERVVQLYNKKVIGVDSGLKEESMENYYLLKTINFTGEL